MDRRTSLKVLSGSMLAAGAWPAFAQEGRGIVKIEVPYAAGGQTDSMSRLIGASMQNTLGRTVITENRPGAAALIAARYVQNSAPDGNTMLFHNAGFVALPMLQKAANYDPIKDFDPVAMVGNGPSFLMVHDSVPAKTIPEFLAYARAQSQPLSCANSGVYSGGHIAALLLEKLANIKLLHVPFKGSGEVTTAMITGQVKMQISVTTDALNPYIKSGKIRVLGVATKDPSYLVPDVPPIGRYVPGYAFDSWFGLLAPAHTPLATREKLAAAVKVALTDPKIKDRLAQLYMEVQYHGPQEFGQAIGASVTQYQNFVRLLQLKKI